MEGNIIGIRAHNKDIYRKNLISLKIAALDAGNKTRPLRHSKERFPGRKPKEGGANITG
jgi:hypothetical protein